VTRALATLTTACDGGRCRILRACCLVRLDSRTPAQLSCWATPDCTRPKLMPLPAERELEAHADSGVPSVATPPKCGTAFEAGQIGSDGTSHGRLEERRQFGRGLGCGHCVTAPPSACPVKASRWGRERWPLGCWFDLLRDQGAGSAGAAAAGAAGASSSPLRQVITRHTPGSQSSLKRRSNYGPVRPRTNSDNGRLTATGGDRWRTLRSADP
jgi:hypothetical protein